MPRVSQAKRSTSRPKTVVRYVSRPTYRGYGAYSRKPSTARKAAAGRGRAGMKYPGAGAAAGTAIGGLVGGPAGAALGGAIGGVGHKLLHALTGFGDYQVMSNALMETGDPPRIENRGKEFVIRHREYITDIYSASGSANSVSGFNLQSFLLNPGNFVAFPWLSQIAGKFEQYRVEGIVLEFKSMYSDAVVTANGALGNVILATEYNAGQPNFQTKQQMENYEFAQSVKPSCSTLHPIECKRNQNVLSELYIRTGSVPAGEDIKTYDFGNFQIATVGIPLGAAGAAVNLGELWITYQIALLKPKIATSGSVYIDSGWSHYSAIGTTATAMAGAPVSPSGSISSSSNLGVIYTPTSIQIPCLSYPMNYLVTIDLQDTTAATGWYWNGTPVLSVTNGSVSSSVLKAQSGNAYWTSGVAGTAQGLNASFVVSVNQASASNQYAVISLRTYSGTVTGTDLINSDIFINALPQNAN